MPFDVEGARKAGYSDDEILSHLTSTRKFDVDGALKAGYTKGDIISHLSSTPAPTQAPTPQPSTGERVLADVKQGVKDFGDTVVGAGKGLLQSAYSTAKMIPPVQAVERLAPKVMKPANEAVDKVTTPTSTRQKVGYGLETAAEILMPTGAAGKAAAPANRMKNAGKLIEEATQAAGNLPIDITKVGNQALRVKQLADRGGTLPGVVRKFLNRVTDPTKEPMTFKEARDFYNNASRLTRADVARLTPPLKRAMAGFAQAMHETLLDAATQAGKGDEYARGIKNYARAAEWGRRLRKAKKILVSKGVSGAIGGGAATATGYGVWKALSGE